MFEKSLYDLIRGLRNHKGNEREYIQESLRECRKEIKGQDMNLKATALLKITYLEMFGHDMSWASFNVLEVMSSQSYVQKKVGYLAAIQSFRPDTEVLMLAENLLKKDLTSPTPVTISLPLVAIPHMINPSMANSLLADLLPRLTHTHAAIRKKTIVTLYRLALVYPETLRPAWPKIKERLQDENEDPSVTSAIINVVCELGWRRPQDFLPLAPRLFDLLVEGGNNWMAIKIIKLFATLTPLEPRLIRKLLPPLTIIIKTTPAMSLLYECINGIVQGGILDGAEGMAEGEEIARLCVGKLRGMLVVEGDPNLKYVALLAFQKIVTSHPHLVSLHQDVILECIDDADISIRMRALDLAVGMVNADNLAMIVESLVRQLINAPTASLADDAANDRGMHAGVEPLAESDDEDAEESLRNRKIKSNKSPPLPEDYRINAIRSILDMCSRDTYVNLQDFEWYISILVQLVKACPSVKTSDMDDTDTSTHIASGHRDISYDIGHELQNVAVRVKSMRPEATAAAQTMLLIDTSDQFFPSFGNGGQGVLESCAWIAGEYPEDLTDPDGVLNSLLHVSNSQLPANILAIYVHSALKVFASICGRREFSWTPFRRTNLGLLMARIVYFLEPLATHPDLDVQERAVEYLEILRLASEAASGHAVSNNGKVVEPPMLLTQAIPGLFTGMELNPVAASALRKVPSPNDIDLSIPINSSLESILKEADSNDVVEDIQDTFQQFYSEQLESASIPTAAADRLDLASSTEVTSYQNTSEDDRLDPETQARNRSERKERYRDDPFYIGNDGEGGVTASLRLHDIIKNANGDDLDIDSIPIMDLDMEAARSGAQTPSDHHAASRHKRQRRATQRKHVEIISDETIGGVGEEGMSKSSSRTGGVPSKAKKALLQVDSSGLGGLSLEGGSRGPELDFEQREAEESALREVERLRLEMQRASERIQAKEESVVVRRKKKARQPVEAIEVRTVGESVEGVVKKKKKTKKKAENGDVEIGVPSLASGTDAAVKPKKKKRQQVHIMEPGEES